MWDGTNSRPRSQFLLTELVYRPDCSSYGEEIIGKNDQAGIVSSTPRRKTIAGTWELHLFTSLLGLRDNKSFLSQIYYTEYVGDF